MKEICKQSVIRNIKQILTIEQNRPYADQAVLILDTTTSKVLSRIMSVEELLECGITELLSVNKTRKPMPSAVSIYYIGSDSLPYLYKDFQQKELYFSINILLNHDATEEIMKDLGSKEEVIERLASFGELQIPFYYFAPNVVFFNNPAEKQTDKKLKDKEEIQQLKQKESLKDVTEEIEMSHRELIEHHVHLKHQTILSHVLKNQLNSAQKYAKKLCAAIAAGFSISPTNTKITILVCQSKFSRLVCDEFSKLLKEYVNSLAVRQGKEQLIQNDQTNQHQELVILIMDRTFDMLSPLVRSFHYGPLLMDVFNITEKSEEIHILSNKLAPTSIRTDDKIFLKYSNMHIYEAFQNIDNDLKAYMQKSEAAKFHKNQQEFGKNKKMKEVLKEFPEYSKTIKSYNNNILIMDAIGAIKKEQNMDNFGELEHLIVSGMSGRREPEKDKKILQKIWTQIAEITCSEVQKCRLLILGACFLDIPSEETSKLMKELRKIPSLGDVAMNLSKLCNRAIRKYSLSPNLHKNKELFLDRHNCLISMAMEEYLQGGKSKAFKQILLNQSVSKAENSPSKISRMNPKLKPTTSFIVSMCGGLGYNEISNVQRLISFYDKASNKQQLNVSFITDSMMTPRQYLEELCYI